MLIYINGEFVEHESAKISLHDRGFLFGDGLFTTIKVEEGQPQYLDAHLAKLKQQMDLFAIEKSIPQSLVFDFIRRNKLEGGRLKIIVTGGQEAELALPKRGGSLIIMAAPLPVIPKQITLKPIKAPLFPGKLLSYMPRLYLRELAKPCDDCLLLGEGGEILETAVGNLYWELDGQLYTPDPDRLPIYFGVAIGQMKKVRRVVIRLDELPPEAKLFRINALGTSSVIHIDSVD